MLNVKDRVAMVSGANRGIGRAIALRLHGDGYRLSLGTRKPEALDSTLRGDPERVLIVPYDATRPADADAWVAATVDRFGRIDTLVNNAGIVQLLSVEKATEADLDEIYAVNVRGPFLLTQKAFPHLKRCGTGRIVNMASLGGLRVKGAPATYSMTKFAVMAMTHATRFAGWEHGVRVTAICPGPVNTDMMAGRAPVSDADMTQPETIAELVAQALRLPNNASVAFIPINCVLEDTV